MDESAIATRSLARIRTWTLWSEPRKFVAHWCATTTLAVLLTVATAIAVPPHPRDLLWLGGLIVLGVGQAEAGRRIEYRRREVVAGPHINLSSVWTFAGVLLLPPALAAVLVAVLYGHFAARSWRVQGRRLRATPPHRTVGNAGNVTLSCIAAYGVMTWSGISGISISGIDDALAHAPASLINVGVGILTYFALAAVLAIPGVWSAEHSMMGLVAAVIPGRRTADHTWRELFGGLSTNALEFTTLVLGALEALALASPLWPLATGGALVMVWVHKGVLDKQLDLLGELDHTTRLYNMMGFYKRAADELNHAHGGGAILLIEIDQVAHLNKGYSRVAGDDVLAAVADTVRGAVSDCAVAVGRFTGPERFAVLLRDTSQEQAVKIADLIRTEVAWMKVPVLTVHGRTEVIKGMSVSIGVAHYTGKGRQIHKILYDADTAVEVARQLGGNQVCTA